ncbi:hypothetical protein [Oxynema aestuarii]|jgi:hypothetical protein|uniref:Uncharacterized protein n=1 Tax=Oxynema aestuarii AP17 TaxID=2064643 RepID=A0A6H1U4B9_9CYAN|nr:hypothetical protein [Oxynema aestuarii]QIZ72469.1 hypothetical protein HCG48_19325 [Oxynema aestuarii AP17]RMH74245.1 MAG: hypothetical protein D6680_15180 [Cyanobacteria bacterium J007]
MHPEQPSREKPNNSSDPWQELSRDLGKTFAVYYTWMFAGLLPPSQRKTPDSPEEQSEANEQD